MKIVLLGAGGHASDVLAALEALQAAEVQTNRPSSFQVLGCLADGVVDHRRFDGRNARHLGGLGDLARCGATHYLSCVGYPAGRRTLAALGDAAGLAPFTLVHPRAWLPPTATIGPGSVLLAGSCLSPKTALGSHVLVGQGAILGHDCVVGDFSSIMPGACVSGDTRIGSGVVIGANATVVEKRTVGDSTVVGAGAVVTRDVPGGVVAKGVPARWN